jgi:hypothetical protein
MKFMTKTCGNCGNAALDNQAQFCDRCGAAVPDKPKTAFPVCPACGVVVSDTQAQFCNRCGAKIPPEPLVCNTCGIPAVDDLSRFCTRCGATYGSKPVPKSTSCPVCGTPDPGNESVFCNRCGAPMGRQGPLPVRREDPAAVIVSQKRAGSTFPEGTAAGAGWEPPNREPAAQVLQRAPVPYQQQPVDNHDFQVAVPQRKYSHLPLIADELKGKETPASYQPDAETVVPSGKNPTKQKKGVLGFLKK